MDILRYSHLVVFSPSTTLKTFPTKALQVFSSNPYEVPGGETRKWRWIFAFDRCETRPSYLESSALTWLGQEKKEERKMERKI